MRWVRRLQRWLFGDDRFETLVRFSVLKLGRAVIFDDEYLARVSKSWSDKDTNVKWAIGGCPPGAGQPIVLSSSLHGEQKLYVLIHELGHALDFLHPERVARFNELWDDEKLDEADREFVLDLEEQAYVLGKQLVDQLNIDIDEDDWMRYVGRKIHENIQTYSQAPEPGI